ncbi:MAG: hypothetical protein J6M60_06005 [Clostridia bacterium]|nr:hypothetical protein [Clostridia bacterium]
MNLENIINNNLTNEKNINLIEKQNNFLETALGKTINFGLDIGLRALLPNFVEDAVIEIKNTLLKEGFEDGAKQLVKSAIDIGKSALGIVTGNFDNISQVQTAIKNGGIIDGLSDLTDSILNKTVSSGKLSYNIANTIKKGKNVILDSVSNKIEQEFNSQLDAAEKLQKYSNNWKDYLNNRDFEGMEKEYKKMQEKLKILIPMEQTLKEARTIENLHTLIKNNGQDFNLTEEQMQLAKLLS